MKKLCLGFLALTLTSTVFAGKNTASFITYAKIVDIEDVWRTTKVKRYSDCRDITMDGKTSTLCDTMEWQTINDSIDFYRVTYELHGKTFTMKHKTRPTGIFQRMSISVKPYGKSNN